MERLYLHCPRVRFWTAPLLGLLLSVLVPDHVVFGAVPTATLYPFAGADLIQLRALTKGESRPTGPELSEAWGIYGELQGVWKPGATPPKPATIARLDRLKTKLESKAKPAWFEKTMADPRSIRPALADQMGDALFEAQKDTPDYQTLKALAILCLAEHEIDRPTAANRAGTYLTVLSITHPWDWEVHALYARLLLDAGLKAPAWNAARQSLFLNPAPSFDDLTFFAFVGGMTAKDHWSEIQQAIQQAALDPAVAERAIKESARLYRAGMTLTIVPAKKP